MVDFPPSYCPACGGRVNPEERPRYVCADCGRTVFHSPAVATQVAVVDEAPAEDSTRTRQPESRVLLGERGTPPGEGRYTTPGGHIDLWEAPEEAAVRELHEETGLLADSTDLILLDVRDLTAIVPQPGLTDEKQVICVDYAIPYTVVAGNPDAADDLAGLQWVGESRFEEVEWAYEQDPLICRAALTTVESNQAR